MKLRLVKILILSVLASVCIPASAQMRIYTRSHRIQDFQSKTTHVVLSGDDTVSKALREEVTSLWTVSPYEFCTPADYEKGKSDPSAYFLRTENVKGIISLVLCKGGREGGSNTLNAPMTIVNVPVAGENYDAPLLYMPAFVSFVQDYMISAITSESAAYTGLSAIRVHRPFSVKVIKDPAQAAEAFRAADGTVAVEVIITPDGTNVSRPRCRYVIGPGGYELYSFSK